MSTAVKESAENSTQASESAPVGGSTEGAVGKETTGNPGATEGAPAPKEGGEEEKPAAAADAAPTAEGEAPKTWKPREKFKYKEFDGDAQKEVDVPAWAKKLMTDEATEKEIISLFEQAHGMDYVKKSRQSAQQERDHFKGEFSRISDAISDVRKTFQRGDIDAFLEKLSIPQERMLQWALDKVNYSQLPPEQQKILDERRDAQRRAYSAEQQSQTYESLMLEQARNAKSMMLQATMSRPDVKSFAEAYDARVGKPGAFVEEVRATGEYAWHSSQGKNDLTPDQAVELVLNKWRPFVTAPAAPAPQAPAQTVVMTPQPKPAVIPNLQGKSSSPLKKGPRSIEDLKKLRDSASA